MKMRMYRKNYVVIIAFIFFSVLSIKAQNLIDDNIMKAMQDELQRNYVELAKEREEKPFFISYTIANARNTTVSASLGALNNSNRQNYKDWSVRLMVGDYTISDENFNYSRPDEMVYETSIPMPVDNDYLGIRKSLWLTTNNIYESAATTYKNKIALIKHKQLGDSALEIADFSRTPVVKMAQPCGASTMKLSELEVNARELSKIFSEYPEIFSSNVVINVFESVVYFLNSEGTEVRYPLNITTLTVLAGAMTNDSEKLNRNITYAVDLPENLPSVEEIKKDIRILVDNMLALKKSERFEEDYTGPVLMIGEAVAETMEKFLFKGSEALIAYREMLESTDQMNIYYQHNANSFQSKIDKLIISKELTIVEQPFMKEYMGQKLLGSYSVDAEGVIPPANLVLVENGILKTLLNGRTPSRYIPESNGHMRFNYSSQGISGQVGPGVVKITSNTTSSMEELKSELLKQAAERGLDFAIIIRSLEVGGSDKPHNYYKVSVVDGSETLIRSARMKSMNMQVLRRSPLFADTSIVHNTLLATGKDDGRGLSGVPSSFIVPAGMLLEELEMESYRKPLTSMLPVIDNPVGILSKTIVSTEAQNKSSQ